MEVISTSFFSSIFQIFPTSTMIKLGRAAHERGGPNFSSFYHLPKFSNKTDICHYYHVFPITLCILTKEKVLTYALTYAILVSERKRTNGGQRQRISKNLLKGLDKLSSLCYNQDVKRSKQEIKSKKNKKKT